MAGSLCRALTPIRQYHTDCAREIALERVEVGGESKGTDEGAPPPWTGYGRVLTEDELEFLRTHLTEELGGFGGDGLFCLYWNMRILSVTPCNNEPRRSSDP